MNYSSRVAKKLSAIKNLKDSIWLFPVIMAILLILLTVFRISGSSIGTYHKVFYGGVKDPHLLFGIPRDIRSDEWLVDTQMTIAQKNNSFEEINQNIGNGENLSLLADAPYKDWSVLFKPHLLAYFVLPFDNAFAFRWWFMAYLLIMSCYFLVLEILPGRRLFASLISLAFFLSPFIQWWYLFGTLGVIYYSLLGVVVFLKLIKEKGLTKRIFWGLALSYLATCFVLVLYPPFQIPCAIAVLVFVAGYLIEKFKGIPRRIIFQKFSIIVGSLVVAGFISFTFVRSRQDIINTVQNTAYPGNRIVKSGGFDAPHLFSSHLGAQFQFESKSKNHSLPKVGLTNQSESSNFILLLPFLLLPSLYLVYKYRSKEGRLDWPLILMHLAFLFLLAWLFVPNLDFLGNLTLLKIVPHQRLLIGLGILNILQLILFVRRYESFKSAIIRKNWIIFYVLIVFFIEVVLGLYAHYKFPGFISIGRILIFSLPIPLLIYCLFQKKLVLAGGIFLVFSLMMTFRINPIYQGTDIITNGQLSKKIQEIGANDNYVWATDQLLLENFAAMNNERSLSGVYTYPQMKIWQTADPEADQDIYNRYAHIVFSFDRDLATNIPTRLSLVNGASLNVNTEPCSQFLKDYGVRYLLSSSTLNPAEKCLSLIDQVDYPNQRFYIYQLSFN
ncbi:hypothetical protein DYH10_01020 [Candidatus Saccharibacteria bacterium CPR2]|nr:hypothetical protein [Candidatus Saccharibacteria bacterium CPR2]